MNRTSANSHDPTALITGGARRVGRAIALELAAAGCDVAVHFARSRNEADEVVADIRRIGRRSIAVCGELNDTNNWPKIVDQVVTELGSLDILVNNASSFATTTPDTLDAFDPLVWQSMLTVNLIAPVALCHHAGDHLRKSGRGKIINLCDISVEKPWPSNLAYCSSKAGLVAATRALARAFAPRVQVNGIAPGIAVFPEDYSPELRRQLIDKVPLNREGTPEEVAKLVRFLVESGHYITGQVIAIDGGRSVV
jgi:pteridine reductase